MINQEEYEQFLLPCMSELTINTLRLDRGRILPSTMSSANYVWIVEAAKADWQKYDYKQMGVLKPWRDDWDPEQQDLLYKYLRFVGFSHEEAEKWKVGQYKKVE